MIKTKSIICTFLLFLFLTDIANAAQFPKLDFEGFTELKLSKKVTNGNPELYQKDPLYQKLPLDLISGPLDIDRTMKLGITGRLSRKLSVSYDIEQEPDFPDKFDIKVNYDKTHLTFFNYDTEFKQGEFINTRKSVNGVNLTTEDDHFDINMAFGKERSEPKKVVFNGTGDKTYSIGQHSLVEKSEKVYINEALKERDKDYVIDYFEGKVVFKNPVAQTDVIKIIYEFTNPMEDFLPVLARKNFSGFRIKYDKKKSGNITEQTVTFNEYLTPYYVPSKNIITDTIEEPIKGEGTKGPYYLKNFPIIKYSEKIYDQDILLQRNADYTIDYKYGEVNFNFETSSQDQIKISYQIEKAKNTNIVTENIQPTSSIHPTTNLTVTKNIKTATPNIPTETLTTENILGKGKKGPYFLMHYPVIDKTEIIIINGIPLKKNIDYTINYPTGRLDFALEVFQEDNILINYKYTSKEELTKKRLTDIRKNKIQEIPTDNTKINIPVGLEDNTFQLQNFPIVLGSEELYLNGKLLTKDKDYYLDYLTGRLLLLKSINEDDELLTNYKYKRSKPYSEELYGENSPGPYELSNSPVVKKSEKVTVNDLSLEKDLDYFIDYDKGAITFTIKITPIDNVRVDYNYILTDTQEQTPTENPLSLGFTYLKETAKPTEENLVVAVSNEVPSVNGTTLILNNNPVESSVNVTVYTGATGSSVLDTVPSSSYTIDYYLGQIDFSASPNTINAENVQVSYSYRKSFRTETSFMAIDGFNNSFYDENNIDFIDVPMKYQSEEVTIRGGLYNTEVKLERGIEYEIENQNNGQDNRIRFFKYDASHQGSQLMDFPNSSHIIRVKYSYTPQRSPDFGNINHQVYGIDFTGNYKGLHLEAETAYSVNNFSRKEVDGSTSLTGTGVDNQYYQLSNTDLVEDSEDVFINDYLQTRDTDYIINYSTGRIRFKNKTPTLIDRIYVTYQYYSTDVTTTQEKKVGNAWRTSLAYTRGDFYIGGRYLDIDKEFSPIGTIKEDIGTKLIGATTAYKFKDKFNFKFDYDSRDIFAGYKDDNSILNKQKRRYESTLTFTPNKYLKSDYAFYSNYILQPSTITSITNNATATPSIDSYEESHKANVLLGPESFLTKINIESSDFKDNTIQRNIKTAQYNLENIWEPDNSYGLEELKLVSHYTKYKNRDDSPIRTYNKDIKDYGFDFNFSPFDAIRTKTTYYRTKIDEFESTSPTDNRTENNDLHNNTFRLELKPVNWFGAMYSRQKEEVESPLNAQLPDQEMTRRYQITKFQPYGLLSFIKGKDLGKFWNTFKQADFSYSKSFHDYKKHNRKKLFNSNVNNYSFRNFNILPSTTIDYFTFSKGDSLLNNYVESSSASSNINYTENTKRGFKFTINPKNKYFKALTYTFRLQDDLETRISTYNIMSGTSNVTINKLPQFDRYQIFSIAPPKIKNFGLLNFIFEESLFDDQDSQEELASSNIIPTLNPTIAKTIDNQYGFSKTYLLIYEPLANLKSRSRITNKTEYYNRNRILSAIGSIRRNTFDRDISFDFKPHNTLKITGLYKRLEQDQFSSPTVDIGLDDLPNNNDSRLIKNTTLYQPGFIYTPLNSFSFKLYYNRASLYQEYLPSQNAAVSINNILTNTYTVGLTLRPEYFWHRLKFLNTLTVSYEYDFKGVKLNASPKQSGVTTRLNISYSPINISYTQLTFSYFRESNRGIGINAVDQSNLETETNEISQSVVKQVDDNYTKASATLSIDIPIKSPVVEKVNISAEWQLVKQEDKMNRNNDYGINAFYIKARLIF